MHVSINRKLVFEILDVLLARWNSNPKKYPFNRPDAILPQSRICAEIRRDMFVHACFYFYACVYMRGGIESLQVFQALEKMWKQYPHFFEPRYASMLQQTDLESVLRQFIGWDAKAASRYWIENSRRLNENWKGSPLELMRGVRTYKEALRRIKNKRLVREQLKHGKKYEGFMGFQPKMVSMLVYFFDYEGWLTKRFIYPSPADFHNFRIALSNGAMKIVPGQSAVRSTEKISAPWRGAVVAYLRARRADPIAVSDVLWLFSLVMCGNSPASTTKEVNGGAPLIEYANVPENWNVSEWSSSRSIKRFEQTCLVCPFLTTCTYAIPSRPYYSRGLLVLRERYKIEKRIDPALVHEPKPSDIVVDDQHSFAL
ncbi:MAG TPA: hypothetical protein VD928_02530 [Candidatus Paceibacterota bacterium]|nr:hypothetical protein [Candidatus Paceibacterota bacterium]